MISDHARDESDSAHIAHVRRYFFTSRGPYKLVRLSDASGSQLYYNAHQIGNKETETRSHSSPGKVKCKPACIRPNHMKTIGRQADLVRL